MTYVDELSRILAARGHTVSILSPGPRARLVRRNRVVYYSVSRFRPASFPVRLFYSVCRYILPQVAERLGWAEAVKGFMLSHPHFDIVEAPEWGSGTLLISGRRRPKIIVRLHKSELQYKKDNMLPLNISDYIVDLFERVCILKASAVTSPTRFMVSQYTIIGLLRRYAGSPIRILPNSVKTYRPPKASGKKIHNYLLTVGRVEIGKGSMLLAEAFARITHEYPSLRLVFVGEDTNIPIEGTWRSYTAYIRSRMVTREAADRIKFIPRQTRMNLARYYRNCLLYVSPSRGNENASMSILEALMHGKAIIGSTAGGTPELVHHKKNGLLFASEDADDLVSKLRFMIDHPAFRHRCENNARAGAFRLEETVKTSELLFRELVMP